ncbi:MAG: M14 family zinc carboxypeptidase [Pseudomonadota bacterium]|nr:M14 family zinc carboxypeptidase [Pseudomonadota bacterium]
MKRRMTQGATLFATSVALLIAPLADAQQRIVQWSATTATNANDNLLALGYAVPIPVDTPLPFDGFRSYSGLHTRHQDLVGTTELAHAHVVGTTRAGRSVWAYRLGDADRTTVWGLPEPATLTNGGIHAREWQSPEVVTGVMELLTSKASDTGFYRYLLDNVNIMVIPVLNVDGFVQTQRFPRDSWLGTDPDDPSQSPRDGRMRRKNMLNVDEVMTTQADHLNGVDLNRNNPPYWASNNSSSSNVQSIVHHGASPHSEPETQALVAATELGPASQLRVYTDVHSFGRVLFWSRSENQRLTDITQSILAGFSAHHSALPNGRNYVFPPSTQLSAFFGIGTTDELFTHNFQVPAWTLEIEPPGDTRYHRNEPLCGANYGGVAETCHDGFILPEAQIRRVRENVSETMAGVFYRQAGPPSVTATQIFDQTTGALVFESQWDVTSDTTRRQITHQAQPLQLDRDYTLSHRYDKPMRWRSGNVLTPYPGVAQSSTEAFDVAFVNSQPLTLTSSNRRWLNQSGAAPDGYNRYSDDTTSIDIRLPRNATNLAAVVAPVEGNLRHADADLTGQPLDANPATVVRWQLGAWAGYEDISGAQTDSGGLDASVRLQISDQALGDPFVLVPGSSSAWYDTARSGEGFVIEILSNELALAYFFTYNALGEQDWYTMVGQIRGNRVIFPDVVRSAGGTFGPGFNPANITRTVVGSATFAFGSCESGWMDWTIDGVKGRMELSRLTRMLGLGCGASSPVAGAGAGLSGSWYDTTHSGEGYVLEMLSTGGAIVYWFSYDLQGNRRWFFGTGELVNSDLVFSNMLTTRGPRFGAAYNPADLMVSPWGSLTLDIDCNAGRSTYNSSVTGFGSGGLQLSRLTRIAGLDCVN